MKTRFLMGDMIQYLPGELKDAIHHASQEAGQDTDKLELHRRAHSEKAQTNQIDPKCRKSLKYVSARTQDRDDEIVVPNGIDLKDFMKYGHVLVNHNYSLLPVGSDDWIIADDFGIKALTTHADTGEGTLANVIWHLVSQGHMKASSIGFVPVETTKPGRRDWDTVANKLQREWPEFSKAAAEKSVSRIITKGVLLEHSFVSVPCNVDAEVEQIIKGMGIKDEAVFKGLGWKVEEKDGILVPKREVIVIETPDGKKVEEKGGSGSGNFGHAGRPGKVGGSSDEGKSNSLFGIPFAEEGSLLGPDKIPYKGGVSFEFRKDLPFSLVSGSFPLPSGWVEDHDGSVLQGFVLGYKDDHYLIRVTGIGDFSAYKTKVEAIRNPLYGKVPDGSGPYGARSGSRKALGKMFDGEGSSEKSMDLTCSRKLASLRKRLLEDQQEQLDALEAEMEGLAADDTEGWKALNGKLNALLAGLKKRDEEETEVEEKGMTPDAVSVCEDCEHQVKIPARGVAPKVCPKCGGKMSLKKKETTSGGEDRVIKVVQPPPSVKVLFAPLDAQEVARVAGEAAEKAISRRMGRLS